MITIFELKNKSYCGCFIRTPYYIKNFFILVALLLFLSVTYLIYFSREGVYMKSITKILRGLNSETYNYLQGHKESLRITPVIQTYRDGIQPTPQQFMTDCLRLNRPCIFDGMGLNSSAVNKWGFGMKYDILDGLAKLMGQDPSKGKKTQNVEPYKYLLEKIGNKEVAVYQDND